MKNKLYLMKCLAGVLILASLAMCKKNVNKAEVAPGLNSTTNKLVTIAAEPTANCSYTVQTSQWFVDGTGIAPGSVICIPAGNRGALLLKNFKGTADNPIIIINKGGVVRFSTTTTASYGFKTQNCQYFKIVGTGVSSIKYGFVISGGNISMTMDDLSSDFEISNVEVKNSGFAGIMAKTDPSCDIATQRGHFTMRNIKMHDNYVHKTGGEGFYVGNSFYADGSSISCGKVLPHDVVNVNIYNNIVDSTGCEGIQVGSAISGAEIHNNIVTSPGLSPFASGQNNGIQIGEGTGGKCFANLIKNAPGNGIIVLGLGDNLVYANIIINAGAYGIFADSRYTPGPHFEFINNTIIAPALDGIKLNSESIPMNTVINNLFVIQGAGTAINRMSTSVRLTASNNYVVKDVNACKFKNFTADDFHLTDYSPMIGKGMIVLSYGVGFDYYGTPRPNPNAVDVGATEF
ncbi:hypothetical protein A0256_16310 [Mucilaginibacter sp. PAMC 26640]|nr:hypothetical protein A0256_16310 [Mucilaginibacter sp. PAMC 26640]